MALSTGFKDDILNESVNKNRKYHMTHNDDGTVSFVDVTSYSQTGSEYGAAEVNEERQAINELNSALALMNTVGATDGSSFSKNFLNVGISNPDDERNKRTYFVISQEDQDDFTNVPPGLFKSGNASAGIREVYRISQNLAMIKITEIHPVPGTQYFRTYNNGTWNSPGWKVTTPE